MAKPVVRAGAYDLMERVAGGFWGPVWRARDASGNEALLRVVEAELTDEEAAELARAVRDGAELGGGDRVRLAAWVDEPRAVRSEAAEGVPLSVLMAAAREGRIALAPALALRIVKDMAGAVARLHEVAPEAGGLTPEAFWVGSDGRTRLFEPGLAPLLRRIKTLAQHPGRLGYDAQEGFQIGVALGEGADVFSIGVIAWELLRGERLFASTNTFKIISQLRSRPVGRVDVGTAVAPEVADVIQRATEREAADRYARVAELDQALAAAAPEIAGAGAVAAVVAELLPSERQRAREAEARLLRIAEKTREAQERRSSPEPPARPRRPQPLRAIAEVAVPTGRMRDPRARAFLWIALALAAVVAIGYQAARNRPEEALYIMQVVRPPAPPPPQAGASASGRARPPVAVRRAAPGASAVSAPPDTAESDPADPYEELEGEKPMATER